MSKTILIVDSDSAGAGQMRGALEQHGFQVQETADGKGCLELTRKVRPDLVVLAVELPQGQNGYILCGKFKKDDELKATPIIIVGPPDGFAAHRKLKSRADDYLAKPGELADVANRVGKLVGFPETAGGADDALSLTDLVQDEPVGIAPEEIAIEAGEEATVAGDPELDMLDAAFEDLSTPAHGEPTPTEAHPLTVDDEPLEPVELDMLEPDAEPLEPTVAASPALSSDDLLDMGALDALGADEGSPLDAPLEPTTFSALEEPASPPPPPPSRARASPPAPAPRAYTTPSPEAGDLRALRAKVAELQAALEDARAQASAAESRAQELDEQLHAKSTELETARTSGAGAKSEKEFFALREAANKKDKEILRLKSELNARDQEMVDLRDREVQLEQQVAQAQGEYAKRDALIKTANARAEQLAQDKRRQDQLLAQAKEEARAASAQASALQAEADELRGAAQELQQLRDEADEARRQLEELRAQLDSKHQESAQALDEAEQLRQRVAELEGAGAKHEERLSKLYTRIKAEEKVREKMRKALTIAAQLLDEPSLAASTGPAEGGDDESAAA